MKNITVKEFFQKCNYYESFSFNEMCYLTCKYKNKTMKEFYEALLAGAEGRESLGIAFWVFASPNIMPESSVWNFLEKCIGRVRESRTDERSLKALERLKEKFRDPKFSIGSQVQAATQVVAYIAACLPDKDYSFNKDLYRAAREEQLEILKGFGIPFVTLRKTIRQRRV